MYKVYNTPNTNAVVWVMLSRLARGQFVDVTAESVLAYDPRLTLYHHSH
jgi:hypothetical protein